MGQLIITETIHDKIFLIRGHKVMLSIHLAELYEVETRTLVQAVKRNSDRFPPDFVFQLTLEELEALRSQFVTLKDFNIKNSRSQFVILKQGQNIKYLPYAFTEQGVAMLSSVLRSKRAVQVNIAIMRAFVKLREILSTHKELAAKFKELEERVGQHDGDIQAIFEAIRQLMEPPAKPKAPMGFHPPSPQKFQSSSLKLRRTDSSEALAKENHLGATADIKADKPGEAQRKSNWAKRGHP